MINFLTILGYIVVGGYAAVASLCVLGFMAWMGAKFLRDLWKSL